MAVNFHRNSSFESDLAGTWEANGVATVERRQVDSAIGDWHAVLVGTGAGNPNLSTDPDARISVATGDEWTVAPYLMWEAGTPKPVHVDLTWYDDVGNLLDANIGDQITPGDSSWLRVGNNNNQAPVGATKLGVRIVVVGIEAGDELGVDAVMVQRGNFELASAWTPGPDEDVPASTIEPEFGFPSEFGHAELRGLVMGKGTPIRLNAFNPFDNTVRVDSQAALSQADGSYSGREYADIKQVPLRLTVHVSFADEAAKFELHQAILSAFAPSDVDLPLRFMWAGRLLRLMGRPRVVQADTGLLTTGLVRVEAGFVALDPIVYADAESSRSLLLPADSGGLTLPFTLPATIDATVTTGRANVDNLGTATTPWRGVIFGPVTNPRLVNFTTGEQLRIGLTVPAGRTLHLDSSTRAVLLDGTASRRGTVSGQWWQLVPGVNDIGWFSDVGDADALLQILYRHAWR